jgi:antitoxin component YwqK of YwqJK toxin-antitoxin module
MSEANFMEGSMHGHEIEYYESGAKKHDYIYSHGLLHGPAIDYYENGKIKQSTVYKDGRVNNFVISYDENGNKVFEAQYLDDVINGKVAYYQTDNKKIAEIVPYENGLISGDIETKGKHGNLEQKVVFKDGVYQGIVYGYYPNGDVKYRLQTPVENVPENELYYNAAGQAVPENLNGTLTTYNPDGSEQAEIPYSKGKVTGVFKTYHPNSSAVQVEAEVTDAKYNGVYKEYGTNGKLMVETKYADGVVSDTMNVYYDDGQKVMSVPFAKGKINGDAVGYYENGKKSFVIPYNNDKINGLLTVYFPNGKVKTEKMYQNNRWNEREYREYDENGKLLYEVTDDGYGTKYYKTSEDGTKTELSEQEKEELLDRLASYNFDDMSTEDLNKYIPAAKE